MSLIYKDSNNKVLLKDGLVGLDTNLVINDWWEYKTQLDLSLNTKYWESYDYSGGITSAPIDTNPYGNQDLLWETKGTKDTSRPAMRNFSMVNGKYNWYIDNTKDYRITCFFNMKQISGGTIEPSAYFGMLVYNDGVSSLLQYISNGVFPSTHYSYYATTPRSIFNEDQWYLSVGYIHNINYPSGSTADPDFYGYIYDMDGNVIAQRNIEVKFYNLSNNIKITNTMPYNGYDKYQQYMPRLEIMDGTEPTISDILSGNNIKK